MQLDKFLNIKYPIIQGGMANIATGEFAACVSNAGGLGLIGAGGMNAESLRNHIREAKKKTDKPFGVNLMLMNPEVDKMAQVVIEEGVKIVTTGAGSPGVYMENWKKAGIKVIPVVPSAALAVRMERCGADAVIAEGTESGGHVGEMTTLTLVPTVVDSVNIPVIAAGGIADGRGMMAAESLGAIGVQVGTVLLATKECPIHDNYKEEVIKAKDNKTIVTGRISGVPVRVLKNNMAREYVQKEKEGLSREELEMYTLGSLRKAVFDGDVKNGSLMAGQISGLVNEIRSVEETLNFLYKDYVRVKESIINI